MTPYCPRREWVSRTADGTWGGSRMIILSSLRVVLGEALLALRNDGQCLSPDALADRSVLLDPRLTSSRREDLASQ